MSLQIMTVLLSCFYLRHHRQVQLVLFWLFPKRNEYEIFFHYLGHQVQAKYSLLLIIFKFVMIIQGADIMKQTMLNNKIIIDDWY